MVDGQPSFHDHQPSAISHDAPLSAPRFSLRCSPAACVRQADFQRALRPRRAAGKPRRRARSSVRPPPRRRPRCAALHRSLDARHSNPQSNPQSAIRNPQCSPRPTASSSAPPRPPTFRRTDAWTLRIGGHVAAPSRAFASAISTPTSGRPSAYLIECSGNADQTNYGLMSTADWEGVPLPAVLDRVRPAAGASRVLVSGVDDDTRTWRTSVPGASWIFTRDELAARDARRSHERRAADARSRLSRPAHRAGLVRLQLHQVGRSHRSRRQTRRRRRRRCREFAARTHQPTEQMRAGEPALARDFIPAVIDTAAMPVRVEKWLAGGRIEYRIAGIIWGGSKPTNALSIRFRASEPWVRVDDCPMPASRRSRGACGRTCGARQRPAATRSCCEWTTRRSARAGSISSSTCEKSSIDEV